MLMTTTAVGVSQHWPGSVVLMDADCHSAVPTGLLGGQHAVSGGLLRVLEAAQFGRDVRNAVWDQSMPLPGDDPDGLRRLFLPGMPTLPGLRSLDQAWGEVAAGLAQFGPAGGSGPDHRSGRDSSGAGRRGQRVVLVRRAHAA